MSIEKLKEQARRHEQKEEWIKALDQYKKAIDRLAEEDQPDIGLYNRVGDLFVRVGNLDAAVEHYEQAVDLYVEAELPNNAIAVCKKVIRNVPDRHAIYLAMGQIRANQGFLPDARTNFLTYAERVAQGGDIEESLRALTEFTRLAPDDVEVRLFLAEQLAGHDRVGEAVDQLVRAHQVLRARGEEEEAEAVRERVHELDPDADLDDVPSGSTEMVIESGAGFVVETGAGADDEDNQYSSSSDPDIQVSVTGTENGDYGIDETPWLDGFEDRNRLEWSEDPGTVSYPSTHAVVGFASETYWSIYRKDYSSRAEPDGVTDTSTDVDFFWMQFDEGDSDPLNDLPDDGSDGGTDPDLRLDLSSQGNPGMPLKVTYWLLSDATWTSIRDNNEGLVVTEGELGTATDSLTSTFDGSQFQISEEIDGIVDGSVLIFKIERDNAGADVDDPNSGQYYFRLQDI